MNEQTKEMIEKILVANNATFVNGIETFSELEQFYGVNEFETGDMIVEMFDENSKCYYRQISSLDEIESTLQYFNEFAKGLNLETPTLEFSDTPWNVYETEII